MAYSPDKFQVMGEDDKPFSPGSQAAVDLLESISAAEKGQAVPYVLLWEIDPTTGKAMHANGDGSPVRPISMIYVEPPKFGAHITNSEFRFRERPPVSLERIVVKSQNPRGIILYRTIDLSFTVHQPDVVFDEHIREDGTHVGNADSWSSLVTPGQAFALEYGWSASTGVKNGILNGDGFSDRNKGVLIPGREQVRFTVTNYNFTITPDGQTRFNIKGYEMGEFNLRQAFLAFDENDVDDSQPTVKAKTKKEVDPYDNDQRALQKLLKKLQDRVADKGKTEKNKKKGNIMVPFGLLFDVVFAEQIEKAYKEIGFTLGGIFVGRFNARTGKPAVKYSAGSEVHDQPISDFTFPLDDIEKVFRDLIKLGTRLTLYNFIEPFVRLFANPSVWDRKGDQNSSDRTIPQVVIRSLTRRTRDGKIEVFFYLFDVNREFTKFTKDDSQKLPRSGVNRAEIKKVVNDKGVPFVSFVRANSYVKDASFETIQDEQMKGIFIRRYLGDKGVNRSQKTGNPDAASKENRSPAAQQIFSPVIKGRVTMLGNFVFDVFNLMWLDFGIRRWDGPFFSMDKEDVIERGEFTTTINVYSAGTDPLGTKK